MSGRKWSILFGLWAAHGAIALWQFLPSQIALSVEEILLASVLLAWTAFNLFLTFSLSRKSPRLLHLLDSFTSPSYKDGIFLLSVLVFFLRVFLWIFQSVADRSAIWFVGYLDRASPLLDLAAIISVETLALILFAAFRANPTKSLKPFFAKLLFVLALLSGIAFLISQTRLGIDPIYKSDWARGLPAVPLLEWQILLACLACVGTMILETRPSLKRIPHPDFWIALAVWGFAAVLWLGQPIVTNPSALEPLEPNFEIYPFNDSQTYDEFSQSLLIGNGFGEKVPQRPLYILFLTVLHLIVGQDYENMIAAQTLVFALFPALLYLFGREFFGRPIGISIALLAILRDITSNLVSPFTGNVSYSKLYLSEIPTAMFLILFLWVGIRWMRSGYPLFSSFLMGGILGIAMLIRTQVVVALPVVLLVAVLREPKKFKPILRGAVSMTAVLMLVAAPWLWRNWRLTGSVIFDSPESQMINFVRYSLLNGDKPQALPLPGETSTEYTERLQQIAREAITSNPVGAAKGVLSAFLNHGVDNLLLFPLQNDVKSLDEFFVPADAFWEEWEGEPTSSQLVLILFYLFLLGLGIATAWHRNGWIGLLPLALNLAYNLWTSLALLAGQRFLVSMDWSVYLYYMLGLFALLNVFLFALERGRSVALKWREANFQQQIELPNQNSWRQYLVTGILFLGVGASLPLAEEVFPQRYPETSPAQLMQLLTSSPALSDAQVSADCVKQMVGGIQRGRALYPRYYEAGGGEWFTDSFGYKTEDEGRLVFTLLRDKVPRIVFPIDEAPSFFPHTADVTLAYGNDGLPLFVLVEKENREAFYISRRFDGGACR